MLLALRTHLQFLNYVHKFSFCFGFFKSLDGIFEELSLKTLCSFPLLTTDLNMRKGSCTAT